MILVVLKAAISTGGTKFGHERRHESIQSTDYSDCKGVSHLWGYNEWPLTLCGREAEVTLVLYTCMMVKCFLSKVRWILWGGKAEKPGRRNKEKRCSAHGAFPSSVGFSSRKASRVFSDYTRVLQYLTVLWVCLKSSESQKQFPEWIQSQDVEGC